MTHGGTRTRAAALLLSTLGALGALGTWAIAPAPPAWAQDEPPAPVSLRVLANGFESARQLPPAERSGALEALAPSLETLLEQDLARDERAALHFLTGAWRREAMAFDEARRAFRQATEDYGKGVFSDDAAFAAIEAVEAAGDDEKAALEWLEWEERHATSPLLPEARLSRAWNALRREQTAEARRILDGLAQSHPWTAAQGPYLLVRAATEYLEGGTEPALALLDRAPDGPMTTYLRALCHRRSGSLLRSAAGFQEVADRYPQSGLRDHALFAKANTFLAAGDFRSAGEEFDRVIEKVRSPAVRAEAELRAAACRSLNGEPEEALARLRRATEEYRGTDVAARAQFLVGEVLRGEDRCEEAIVELNQVLTVYFQHSVAASAQYRVARCLDALGRRGDATSAYQTVVSGYPLEPEAPAAAYLAGVGLLEQDKPLVAAPYFQLVLDRYATVRDTSGVVVFAAPEHREVVEAALCLLEYSYRLAGDLGQLSGAPHLLLQRMPPSRSPWRAHALLIDADASAAQGRYEEARHTLETLGREFPDHEVAAPATKLLAWTYARQGQDSLAVATEEHLLSRFGGSGDDAVLSASLLDIAHVRFNQKRYADAAESYEEFVRRFPGHASRPLALFQAGLCYLRLDRAGDAVDRWEAVVRAEPSAAFAERAWARAGDLYFQAERYEDAKRCYRGLLEHFATSSAAAVATLRMAQCDYNAGRDAEALEGFSAVMARYPGTGVAREAERGQELALYRLGRTAEGAQVLAQLVEQHPTSAFASDAQFQIAWQMYQAKQYAEAAEAFRRVVSQFPGHSAADRAHFLMADSYAQVGAGGEARRAYDQFLGFFPQSELSSTVRFRLGLLQFQDKEYLPAAVSFTSVLEDTAAPEITAAARYNLALCQRLLGRPEEARAELERYRRDYSGDEREAEVAYQLGDLHDATGATAEAAAEFERAAAAGPAGPLAAEVYYRLGMCREKLADPDGALRAYGKAAAVQPKDDPFRLSAVARSAALFEAKQDVRQALAAYRDIIHNAKDHELVAAATDRASQLEGHKR